MQEEILNKNQEIYNEAIQQANEMKKIKEEKEKQELIAEIKSFILLTENKIKFKIEQKEKIEYELKQLNQDLEDLKNGNFENLKEIELPVNVEWLNKLIFPCGYNSTGSASFSSPSIPPYGLT